VGRSERLFFYSLPLVAWPKKLCHQKEKGRTEMKISLLLLLLNIEYGDALHQDAIRSTNSSELQKYNVESAGRSFWTFSGNFNGRSISHEFVSPSVNEHELIRTLTALVILLGITLIVFMKASNWKRADKLGNIFQDFIAILVFKIGAVSFNVLRLSTEYWNEEPFLKYQMLDFLFESFYDLLLLLTLYKWSCGVFGYDSDTKESLVLKPLFKKCLIVITANLFVFAAFDAYESFSNYMKWTIPFFYALNLVTILIALLIVYKNSTNAEKRFPDRNFAEIYGYSRLCFLILPFLVPCISAWLRIVYMMMQILTANNVDGTPDIVYSIIRNLDQFLIVIILWVLFCIWKLHKVDGIGYGNEVKHD
jgi:hypothetical protein